MELTSLWNLYKFLSVWNVWLLISSYWVLLGYYAHTTPFTSQGKIWISLFITIIGFVYNYSKSYLYCFTMNLINQIISSYICLKCEKYFAVSSSCTSGLTNDGFNNVHIWINWRFNNVLFQINKRSTAWLSQRFFIKWDK